MNNEPYYYVAIVGSRNFSNKEIFEEVLKDVIVTSNIGIVSGGARGVDTWAEEFCKEHNIVCKVLLPIDPNIKINYLFRNVEILTVADEVIAFWDGKSKGTKFVIDYTNNRGKKLTIYNNKGEIIDVNN